jgi:sialic acid synthase SpsE
MNRGSLSLAGRLLGEGQPCLVVAHVGHAHEGSADRALKLIEAAFQAGADAIAFSVFRTEELVVRRHPERRELEQLELGERDWRRVLEAGHASGLAVIVEAHDLPSRDLALEAGVDALQSHPRDSDHPELLRGLASAGRPLLLAAGEGGEPLLRDALEAAAGSVAILLGPATAPAPVEELRLSEIASVRERLRVSVGLLDPTDGGSAFALLVPALAAAEGAAFVEKRLVLDRSRKGRDGAAALPPEEFYRMVELLRQSERARGEGASPRDPATAARGRSIVAAGLIGRGEVLCVDRLRFKRTDDPLGRGLRPFEAQRVIGRRAARPIEADELIREDMLE